MSKKITSDHELSIALGRLSEIFHAERGTPEGDEAELLMSAIEAWEAQYIPPQPDPIDMIQYAMEQKGWTTANLAPLMKPNRASEVFKKKRPLSLRMIRWFHTNLGVSLECLVQDYELHPAK